MRASIVSLLVLLAPALAGAGEIYRSTDEQGNPLFTDEPPGDEAEPVELDPITTVPGTDTAEGGEADEAPDAGAAQEGTGAGAPAYRSVRVSYPPADQAVRHNGGLVPFRVALEPEDAALAEGHRVEIVLDGEVRGSGASLQVSVSPVNRGPHTVRARVVDAAGTPLVTSEPVDFFLLRAALGND